MTAPRQIKEGNGEALDQRPLDSAIWRPCASILLPTQDASGREIRAQPEASCCPGQYCPARLGKCEWCANHDRKKVRAPRPLIAVRGAGRWSRSDQS